MNQSNQPEQPGLYTRHTVSFKKPEIYGEKKQTNKRSVILHVLGFPAKHQEGKTYFCFLFAELDFHFIGVGVA